MIYGLTAWLELWAAHRKECAVEAELENMLDKEMDREIEALLSGKQ